MILLGLLETGSAYGYDLKHRYDRLFGLRKRLAFGQIYATLARLMRDNCIEELAAEAGHGPERRRYHITDTGLRRVESWLFTPDIPHENLQSNLFAKTVIALLIDDDAERLLDGQRHAHLERMRQLTSEKRGADFATAALCDHALFHLEADLRWIDLISARLRDLRESIER
ncbi:MAG: PadR family transcriptional regulator [Coriobacteriales bacterium]|jgi:DNA-binding PadR family transcriptional regulator|nr:PadR family transcriptional regulator [Coriobacteriales bacterium]